MWPVITTRLKRDVLKLLGDPENRNPDQSKLIDWKGKNGLRFSLLTDAIWFLGAATKRLQDGGNRQPTASVEISIAVGMLCGVTVQSTIKVTAFFFRSLRLLKETMPYFVGVKIDTYSCNKFRKIKHMGNNEITFPLLTAFLNSPLEQIVIYV